MQCRTSLENVEQLERLEKAVAHEAVPTELERRSRAVEDLRSKLARPAEGALLTPLASKPPDA
ncbi:MAG TPA: hypothetical protein VGC70_11085 [Burkholderiales bacterium]